MESVACWVRNTSDKKKVCSQFFAIYDCFSHGQNVKLRHTQVHSTIKCARASNLDD